MVAHNNDKNRIAGKGFEPLTFGFLSKDIYYFYKYFTYEPDGHSWLPYSATNYYYLYAN